MKVEITCKEKGEYRKLGDSKEDNNQSEMNTR